MGCGASSAVGDSLTAPALSASQAGELAHKPVGNGTGDSAALAVATPTKAMKTMSSGSNGSTAGDLATATFTHHHPPTPSEAVSSRGERERDREREREKGERVVAFSDEPSSRTPRSRANTNPGTGGPPLENLQRANTSSSNVSLLAKDKDGVAPPLISRQSSAADVAVSLSRATSTVPGTAAADAEVRTLLRAQSASPPAGTKQLLAAAADSATGSPLNSAMAHSTTPVERESLQQRPGPTIRSKTFGRRTNNEDTWRSPKHAAELIATQLAEDPQAFRDHLALYWRLENIPLPVPSSAAPIIVKPTAVRPAVGGTAGMGEAAASGRLAALHPHPHPSPNAAAVSPAPSASPVPRVLGGGGDVDSAATSPHFSSLHSPPSSPPAPPASQQQLGPLVPEQVVVFLSLGPSSGAGDKIGSSEPRPLTEKSVVFHPMLLPYHALGAAANGAAVGAGGDPNFSVQVQVWQRKTPAYYAAPATSGGGGAAPSQIVSPPPSVQVLLGYVDVTVLHMFSCYERAQGLVLKQAPQSTMPPGQTPVQLAGTGAMLVVDYIQFYCHTTPAVLAGHPGRWPRQLASPQSDCLWRAQLQAIKLSAPRGCPHPVPIQGGSMSPAMGALSVSIPAGPNGVPNLASLSAAHLAGGAAPSQGVCFFQIWRGVRPGSGGNNNNALSVADYTPAASVAPSPALAPLPPPSPPPSSMLIPAAITSGSSSSLSSASPQWTLAHTSEFLPLSRYPKFAEFQRPLADICEGSYTEVPLLLQIVLTHDHPTVAALARVMPLGMPAADPAQAVAVAMRAGLGLTACSVLQSVASMRELLAGKTKLKLFSVPVSCHTAAAGTGTTGEELTRANTFNLNSSSSIAEGGGSGNGGTLPGAAEDTISPVPPSSGGGGGGVGTNAGTLAFNISQIFSSRASLEALARQRIAAAAAAGAHQRAGGSATSRAPAGSPPTPDHPQSDGFDEAGVVRSTAFLASLLPVGTRRHHRVGSHLRGPSGFMGNSGAGGHLPQLPSGFSGFGTDSPSSAGDWAGAAVRSKTLTSAGSWAGGGSNAAGGGGSTSSPNSARDDREPSMPAQTGNMDSMLQRMGLALSGPSNQVPPLPRRGSKQTGH